MVHKPADLRVLATFHLPLEEFLEGEYETEMVYTQGEGDASTATPSTDADKKVRTIWWHILSWDSYSNILSLSNEWFKSN